MQLALLLFAATFVFAMVVINAANAPSRKGRKLALRIGKRLPGPRAMMIPAIALSLAAIHQHAHAQTSAPAAWSADGVSSEAARELSGLWRQGADKSACAGTAEYQLLRFDTATPTVEIGSGTPGNGLVLPVLAADVENGFLAMRTRICGPPGCSRSEERWRRDGPDTLVEWDYRGRDGDRPPYVMVRDGKPVDGTPARSFVRCG
jgi:hypothetical protein